MAITVWHSSLTLENELQGRDAYLKILTQATFKQKFRKSSASMQLATENFMLPFKKIVEP